MNKECALHEIEPIQMKKHIILEKLKENKFRITKQRKLIIDIILNDNCVNCKQIYYKAVKKDPEIGTATVYRMINTLETIGVIKRQDCYNTICENEDNMYDFRLEEGKIITLSKEELLKIITAGLRASGYIKEQKLISIEEHK